MYRRWKKNKGALPTARQCASYMYTRSCIHRHIRIYIHVYVYVYMCIYTLFICIYSTEGMQYCTDLGGKMKALYIYINISHIYTYLHICIYHIYTYTIYSVCYTVQTLVARHGYVYIHTHKYICINIYTYIYIYAHILYKYVRYAIYTLTRRSWQQEKGALHIHIHICLNAYIIYMHIRYIVYTLMHRSW